MPRERKSSNSISNEAIPHQTHIPPKGVRSSLLYGGRVATNDHDDQLGILVVELWQIATKAGASELGLVILVVENRRFAKRRGQQDSDLFDKN